jgi:hypothetical protein
MVSEGWKALDFLCEDVVCEDVAGTVSHYTGSCACRLLMPLQADLTQMSDGDHVSSMGDEGRDYERDK